MGEGQSGWARTEFPKRRPFGAEDDHLGHQNRFVGLNSSARAVYSYRLNSEGLSAYE